MGCLMCITSWLLAWLLGVTGAIYYVLNKHKFFKYRVRPSTYQDKYYGKGEPHSDDTAIKQFEYTPVADDDIKDLKSRLANTRYNEPLEDVNDFDYGFHPNYLKTIVDYWMNEFDWRKQEERIKNLDHYVTEIEGINVHFVHIKPKTGTCTIPTMLSCGWPSCFYEYIQIIDQIRDENDKGACLEVIIPSIPGYGFSEAPHKKGFNARECARVFAKLMERIGHSKYYLHGSDWSSLIMKEMAVMYPERVKGYHTTTAFIAHNGQYFLRLLLTKLFPNLMLRRPQDYKLLFPLKNIVLFALRETGYMHIQSTKPDTVATGLNDSPAGLAAYILEKYSTWTREDNRLHFDGELTRKYKLDDLLTIVSLYWFRRNINSSQRLYKETFAKSGLNSYVSGVPTGYTNVGHGIMMAPHEFLEPSLGNIVYANSLDDGGHFLALEEPKTFWREVKKFICACERINGSEN